MAMITHEQIGTIIALSLLILQRIFFKKTDMKIKVTSWVKTRNVITVHLTDSNGKEITSGKKGGCSFYQNEFEKFVETKWNATNLSATNQNEDEWHQIDWDRYYMSDEVDDDLLEYWRKTFQYGKNTDKKVAVILIVIVVVVALVLARMIF